MLFVNISSSSSVKNIKLLAFSKINLKNIEEALNDGKCNLNVKTNKMRMLK